MTPLELIQKLRNAKTPQDEQIIIKLMHRFPFRDDWQPIETAPIDEWVLMLDGSNCKISTRQTGCNVYVDKRLKDGQTVNAYLHSYTHWQPLPELPTE